MNKEEGFERQMNSLRKAGLRKQSLMWLKSSRWGKVYSKMYLLIGFISIFMYKYILELNVIASIVLGVITWLVVSWIMNSILIRRYRIDKQLKWLLETPEGLAELKKSGSTDEEIEKLRQEVKNDPMHKEYKLDK